MVPFKEKSIADSSTASFWQDGNLRSSSAAGSNHEERFVHSNCKYINKLIFLQLLKDTYVIRFRLFNKKVVRFG